MPKAGSKRKASQGTSSPQKPSTRNNATEKMEPLISDRIEGRLYMSQLTCKILTWFFWPGNRRFGDISTLVLAFISVIWAYSKFADTTGEGTSSYFLLIELITVASCSVNLVLGEVPPSSAGIRAQIVNLMLTLSSFAVFYLSYEWVFTTCIWTTRKHLLTFNEIRGLENVCSPRRWLCRVFAPPKCTTYYHERQKRSDTS